MAQRGFVKLSEMVPGDVGYLAKEGAYVVLRSGGRAGGCRTDKYLALVAHELGEIVNDGRYPASAEEWPTIVVDTDDVST